MTNFAQSDIDRWNDPDDRALITKNILTCEPKHLRFLLYCATDTPWYVVTLQRFIDDRLCYYWKEDLREGCGKHADGFYTPDSLPYCKEHMSKKVEGFMHAFMLTGGSAL